MVGNKEFEDSFGVDVIYFARKKYVESKGKEVPSDWTIENIKTLKESRLEKGKFGDELKKLNKGDKGRKKPLNFSKKESVIALADYYTEENLPDNIRRLLYALQI